MKIEEEEDSREIPISNITLYKLIYGIGAYD